MKLTVKELCTFSMLGALMYASKLIMELVPNVHLLGVFTIAFTVVYRKKALYPIYVYVLLNGIFCGFATWWIPYLYLWTVLWGVTMLLPKKMPKKYNHWYTWSYVPCMDFCSEHFMLRHRRFYSVCHLMA